MKFPVFWLQLHFRLRDFFKPLSFFPLIGVALGVFTLLSCLAVITGYKASLEKTVQSLSGHFTVSARNEPIYDTQHVNEKIKNFLGDELRLERSLPLIRAQALSAVGGKVQGIQIEGVSQSYLHSETFMSRTSQSKLIEKDLDQIPFYVGTAFAKKYNLKLGSEFFVIAGDPNSGLKDFAPTSFEASVLDIIDFGQFDLNKRMLLTETNYVKNMMGFDKTQATDIRYWTHKPNEVLSRAMLIGMQLGPSFQVTTWKDVNRTLFQAVDHEKRTLFLVLLLILLVASFCVASHLFMRVFQRSRFIAILKVIGTTPKQIQWFFIQYGLIMGVCGALLGFILSLLFIFIMNILLSSGVLIPPEAYKLTQMQLNMSWFDVLLVFSMTFIFCFISSWRPSRVASKRVILEGLRFDA